MLPSGRVPRLETSEGGACVRVSAACAALACAALLLASCSPRPSRETVTTELGRQVALPPDAKTVALTPLLPERDPEIEAAGDRVAEAITHVKHRRGAPALRALGEAQAGARGAMNSPARDAKNRETLGQAVKQMDAAAKAIQHGQWSDAATQLLAANRALDSLHVPPDPNAK